MSREQFGDGKVCKVFCHDTCVSPEPGKPQGLSPHEVSTLSLQPASGFQLDFAFNHRKAALPRDGSDKGLGLGWLLNRAGKQRKQLRLSSQQQKKPLKSMFDRLRLQLEMKSDFN